MTTPAEAFKGLPLLRSIIVVDMVLGTVVVHEVRRDPMTGLTLTATQPQPKQETTS